MNDAIVLVCAVGAFLVLLVVLGVVANAIEDEDHKAARRRNPRGPR